MILLKYHGLDNTYTLLSSDQYLPGLLSETVLNNAYIALMSDQYLHIDVCIILTKYHCLINTYIL